MVKNTTKNSFIFSTMILSVDTAIAVAQQTFFSSFLCYKGAYICVLAKSCKIPIKFNVCWKK